ncbi:JAB domain-containing protein [uncultured Eubacterium sp.]|uniref:JAB domain-containing protein n=1 Tax=uncultured Eubacterium sp. TaxID=165185 RepID=UPI00260F5F71|nr:JAB domain-containing protein [uncultured Eubacterium sp.]
MTDAELKNQMREKLKDDYLLNGSSALSDTELLEMALALSISKTDGKKVADNLIHEFKSLKCISVVRPEQMLKIDGIDEYSAIYLSLMRHILSRIELAKNDEVKVLDNTDKIIEYAKNMLSVQVVERVVMVTLDEDYRVIKSGYISQGTASFANVMPTEVSKRLIAEQPCYVFVAHNHLIDNSCASFSDVNFTLNLLNWLNQFGIELIDHIIVSKNDAMSMASDDEYKFIFD